jgi:hypothetical protein
MVNATTPPQPPTTLGARFILSGLGLVLAVLGLLFTYLLWHSRQLGLETRHWLQTPCEIISSEVLTDKPSPNSPPEYRALVRYRYDLNGSIYHSNVIKRGVGPSTSRETAESRIAPYKVGMKTVCYVNPSDVGSSVLEHTTLAAVFTTWFPMLFAVLGFGMIWSAWRRR